MEKRVLGLLSAVFLFWFGLSGCQSCNCGKKAADEQAGAGPREEGTRQPQPGPENQRVSLENYSGPAEGVTGTGSQPVKPKPDAQALDLSGMPLVEPVETAGKSKAPPATMRITGYLKRLQEEDKRRKGVESGVSASVVSPPKEVPPSPRGGKKVKLSKKSPRGVRKARPGRGVKRGPGGDVAH